MDRTGYIRKERRERKREEKKGENVFMDKYIDASMRV